MHTYLPHPMDRLIILVVREKFDETDRQCIAYLLEDRLREHERILAFVEFQNVSRMPPADWWSDVISQQGGPARVERFAVVGASEIHIWAETLGTLLTLESVRSFESGSREEALNWVQGAKGASA